MVNVLVVAHKPWVASLYESHISLIDEFNVIGIAENVDDIKEFCKNNTIDLVILDVIDNLRFMKKIKNLKLNIDIIPFISFVKIKNIDLYLKLGMVNYLLKPFEYKDFKKVLENYVQNSGSIRNGVSDTLIKNSPTLDLSLSKRTLDRISEFMKMNRGFLTTSEIGENLRLSLNTIRRYLKYLYSIGEVTKKTHQRSSYYKYIAD